jgi:hypothetical protein
MSFFNTFFYSVVPEIFKNIVKLLIWELFLISADLQKAASAVMNRFLKSSISLMTKFPKAAEVDNIFRIF